MAIDRIDWHAESAEQAGFPYENGGTHIGIYLAWIINNHLEGEFHQEESEDEIAQVLARKMTGRDFLIQMCDEKFCEEDLNEEGFAFTQAYYESNEYFKDYDATLVHAKGLENTYAIDDTWENYDLMAPVISEKYQQWRVKQ
ncbi:DUF7832 domain-containing protein [Acinetobacter wuhouensis]|uniref:DUF7832 domain-containing protein n=1 Tax=Acinetobacter wuhouensis TaxID=1879050 RepID=A0A4Q7ABY3_9GAMM|nr:hypothetical protein [Acinetobacter wuhouensis]RZG43071.1 hypothetical protein EXU28_18100 [Acinetobacter wuhouensis]RZG67785.1 hypothetical protein EXU29_18000 [Acinetobacter wuhouensis]